MSRDYHEEELVSNPMVLREEDVRRIGDYVKPWLRDLVSEAVPRRPADMDTRLLERMVRVEEELKAQREIMATRFEAVDKRFDEMLHHSDKRFEAMDSRFDDLHRSFARTQWVMGFGFALLSAAVTVVGLLG